MSPWLYRKVLWKLKSDPIKHCFSLNISTCHILKGLKVALKKTKLKQEEKEVTNVYLDVYLDIRNGSIKK